MAKPAACDEVARPAERGGWARRAEARLPRKSIVALEIGNEPDIYSHSFWQDLTAAGRGARILPASMSATSYAHDFRAYAGALSSPAPDVPLFGPALAEPARNLNWVSGLPRAPIPGWVPSRCTGIHTPPALSQDLEATRRSRACSQRTPPPGWHAPSEALAAWRLGRASRCV